MLLKMPKRRIRPLFPVESRILFLRRNRVILDKDLAELYHVSVKQLNQQTKRNSRRFPSDFMFRISASEERALRSQIVTSKKGRGGRRYLPFAFTEHGAIMAATVLNSERAVQMSVFVVRAFVRLREMLATDSRLAAKINELENRLDDNDVTLAELIQAIRELMAPHRRRAKIGFQLPAANGRA
jgi:phage regulator Rha-like protein